MMEKFNYAALAIPAFFIFLGIEYFVAVKQNKKNLFNYENSVSNLSIGIAERLLNLFLTTSFFELFKWVYERYALFNIPNTWWVWVLILLATDLVWYWYHRLGHEINFLWAAHIVHHQSEDFNYTVSARITVFQSLIRNVFWCMLPLLGFHPTLVIATLVIHGAYSFFTHTQIVKNLGWLEYVFITPSLHGVHHAANEKYINKNYGDLFVFWDKIFGTFEPEDENEQPHFGLTHQLKSHSFLWQHFHYYLEIFYACKRTNGFWAKMKIVFGRPEDLDQEIRKDIEPLFLQIKTDRKLNKRFKKYINLQLVLTLLFLFGMVLFYHWLTIDHLFFGAILIILTLINCGALLEQKKWIVNLEKVRILLFMAYVSVIMESSVMFIVLVITFFCWLMVFPFDRSYWYALHKEPVK